VINYDKKIEDSQKIQLADSIYISADYAIIRRYNWLIKIKIEYSLGLVSHKKQQQKTIDWLDV
jgi:hypothetical protein